MSKIYETFIKPIWEQAWVGFVLYLIGFVLPQFAPIIAYGQGLRGWQFYSLIVLSLLASLIFVAVILFIRDWNKRNLFKKAEDTFLHLRFFNDNRMPVVVKAGNIFSYNFTENRLVDDPNPTEWIGVYYLVVFNKEVHYSGPHLSSRDFDVPEWQSTSHSRRFALFWIKGKIPAGVLEVNLEPSFFEG